MISFLRNIQSMAVVGTVAFLLGSSTAWYVSYKFHEAAKVDMYKEALTDQKAAVKLAIDQAETIRQMDNEFVEAWSAENESVQLDGIEFQKKVGNYVKNNDACNLTVGAVGLLDTLIEGGQADLSALSKTTSGNDEKGQETSKVTQLKTLQHHGSCIENYNKLKIQHNTMVDWIDKTYDTLKQE